MKKTKKQKLLAQLHRQKNLTPQPLSAVPSSAQKISYSLQTPKIPEQSLARPIASQPHPHQTFLVRQDLRQTVVLTLLAICAQLVLWYLLEIKHVAVFKF